jgi:hypothetical protein
MGKTIRGVVDWSSIGKRWIVEPSRVIHTAVLDLISTYPYRFGCLGKFPKSRESLIPHQNDKNFVFAAIRQKSAIFTDTQTKMAGKNIFKSLNSFILNI